MAEIKDEYSVNNVTASLPLTLYYVFYAIIQFVLALFITKINLEKIYRKNRGIHPPGKTFGEPLF